ncbi:hypothetical protein CGMCC3_g14724 [Colletotrichum fructicola]|nr:uncharacterized protein CGMCC3_g14724 [Colletotrichum fructicola]KAE9569124.1 hypothetical protein CGMCC3_g14724 [Colletotrichum fructicola]
MRLQALLLVAAQVATIVAQGTCYCDCNRTSDASGCAALPRPASGNCAEVCNPGGRCPNWVKCG